MWATERGQGAMSEAREEDGRVKAAAEGSEGRIFVCCSLPLASPIALFSKRLHALPQRAKESDALGEYLVQSGRELTHRARRAGRVFEAQRSTSAHTSAGRARGRAGSGCARCRALTGASWLDSVGVVVSVVVAIVSVEETALLVAIVLVASVLVASVLVAIAST
eukprot:3239649-Pleurochrysis_carterae.AAC.3